MTPADVLSLTWKFFREISAIPRPSGHEEQILRYLADFALARHLTYRTDSAGNIVILKPASPGFESHPAVALQAHCDMVCEKNADVTHDFFTDPIRLVDRPDDDWLRADGTTLGADDGIGIAAALAVLESDVPHPALEVLITVEEETGLTGAREIAPDMLTATRLLNLDSEDEGELFIGCAGGIDTVATFAKDVIPATPSEKFFARLTVSGLQGGHSGEDIARPRANALRMLGRLLTTLSAQFPLDIADLHGGNLRNAIPREAAATIAVPFAERESLAVAVNRAIADLESAWSHDEPRLRIELSSAAPTTEIFTPDLTARLIFTLMACPHGVERMSTALPDLVETSTNLASVRSTDREVIFCTSQRSAVEVEKSYIRSRVEAVFRLAGAEVRSGEGYPGWQPDPSSEVLRVSRTTYAEIFGVEPRIRAIHAGLECGLFRLKYPRLDMISFGPTLRDVHSPHERLSKSSTERFVTYLVALLARL